MRCGCKSLECKCHAGKQCQYAASHRVTIYDKVFLLCRECYQTACARFASELIVEEIAQ